MAALAETVPKTLRENLQWRKALLTEVANDPSLAGDLVECCRVDPLFYVNAFVWTYDPRRKPSKIPFVLYDFQEDAFLKLLAAIGEHDILIEKSRDMGASWLSITAFEYLWHFQRRLSFLMISRNETYVDDLDNPKALLWKVDFIHDCLPRWLWPKGYVRAKCRRRMHIFNPEMHSVIDGESTTGQAARGDRRTAILLDEFAAVDEGDRVLKATRDATLSRLFNSTPQGTGNAYYKVAQTNIEKVRLHWSQHPGKSRGAYTTDEVGIYVPLDAEYWHAFGDWDAQKAEMQRLDEMISARGVLLESGKVRSPWYASEVQRCVHAAEVAQELDIDYTGSRYLFFSPPIIEAYAQKYCQPPVLTGDIEWDHDLCTPLHFRPHPSGKLRLWMHLSPEGTVPADRKCKIGIDVAAGTGSSNSCQSIIDQTTCEKIAEYANAHIRPEEFGRYSTAICRFFNNATMIWEINGPGREFGAAVLDAGYRNIYFRQPEEHVNKLMSDVPGWAPTKDNRRGLFGEYRAALEGEQFINRSEESVRETLEYVYTPNGCAEHCASLASEDPTTARDNHGDRCVADALAWKLVKGHKAARSSKPKIPVGCYLWYQEQQLKASARADEWEP